MTTDKTLIPLRRVIARVELPSFPEGDYGDLHECMRLAGWRRVIKGDSGRLWHLPHAVYTKQSRQAATVLRDRVVRLAKASHPEPRVMVEAVSGSAWSRLRLVTSLDPDPDAGR